MDALSAVDVVHELAAFLGRDAPQRNPVGVLTVQVSVVEAVGLGLASNPLGLCIFFGKNSILPPITWWEPSPSILHWGFGPPRRQLIPRSMVIAALELVVSKTSVSVWFDIKLLVGRGHVYSSTEFYRVYP